MTLIVELYGGPGTGKSTTAAGVFARLKRAGVNAELVPEFAKEWAWQDRKIGVLDQLFISATQIHRESRLLGKVDVIVTDSPARLQHFYTMQYGTCHTKEAVRVLVEEYEAETANQGHTRVSVMMERVKPFNPKGRFESEEQARDMDAKILAMLDPFSFHSASADALGEAAIETMIGCLI